MLGRWGYRFVQIKGLDPFGAQSGGKYGTFSKIFKNLLLGTTSRNALICSMEYPWGKEIQVCLNEVPRVLYGPTPGA